MIPRASNNQFTNEMVKAIRDANTSSTNTTVVTIKDAFKHLIRDDKRIEKATYDVRDTSVDNTANLIENIRVNANKLSDNMRFTMGSLGIPSNLVDINYEMLRQSTLATKHLDVLERIQLGGKSGVFAMLNEKMRSIIPFTDERKRVIRAKREARMASIVNKIMKMTYFEQKRTADNVSNLTTTLDRNSRKDPESTVEQKRFFGNLFAMNSRNDKNSLTKRDMKDLMRNGSRLTDFIPLGIILSNLIPLTIGIVGSYLSRGNFIGAIVRESKVGKLISSSVSAVFKGIFESKFLVRFIESFKSLKAVKNLMATLAIITPDKLKFLLKPLIVIFRGFERISPLLKPVAKAFPLIGKFFKAIAKIFPFLFRIGGQLGKFIPVVNIIIAVWEGVRGIFLGIRKIGGITGAIAGLLGGVFEFFTLGIFDMDSYLEGVKTAIQKFKDGDALGGILSLFKAPFDGIKDGLVWLGSKVIDWLGLSGGDFSIGPDSGLVGQLLYWSLYPYTKAIELIKSAGDKISGEIKNRVFGFLGIDSSPSNSQKKLQGTYDSVVDSGQDRATKRILDRLGITSQSIVNADMNTEQGRKMIALAIANANGMNGSARADFVKNAGKSREGFYQGRNNVARMLDMQQPSRIPDSGALLRSGKYDAAIEAMQNISSQNSRALNQLTQQLGNKFGGNATKQQPTPSTIISTTTYTSTDNTIQRELGAGIR